MVWPHPLDVIQYARSSYEYDNVYESIPDPCCLSYLEMCTLTFIPPWSCPPCFYFQKSRHLTRQPLRSLMIWLMENWKIYLPCQSLWFGCFSVQLSQVRFLKSYCIQKDTANVFRRLDSSVGRTSAFGAGGPGFKSGPCHIKGMKDGTSASLADACLKRVVLGR